MSEKIAIIGGTGLETLEGQFSITDRIVSTVFGDTKVTIVRDAQEANGSSESADQIGEIIFLSRHGASHSISPHEINYQANIAALVKLGVTRVYATNAVGSLRLDIPPGSLLVYDNFIDFTKNRTLSFWDNHPNRPPGVVHTDFSNPYCPLLRSSLLAMETDFTPLIPSCTYVCAEGPRFESPAEVRMFAQWGGDVVGMTGLPEAIYAREAGLCYAGIGIVTNYGAGLTAVAVDHLDVVEQMSVSATMVRDLILKACRSNVLSESCGNCGRRNSV